MRETSAGKALRYLGEGRLVVTLAGGGVVEASCRGGGAVYALGYSGSRGWWCDCPARGICSHLVALQLVTTSLVFGGASNEGGT